MNTNKILYRGVRLHRNDLQQCGMDYYWDDADQAISDIYRVLDKFHKVKKLGTNPILRSYLKESGRSNRLQIWATEDRNNALSYARHTPELIYLVLSSLNLTWKQLYKYLDKRFGLPHLVTFKVYPNQNEYYSGINLGCGKFIPPEDIISVEPVDMKQPDPWMSKFRMLADPVTMVM